MSGQVMATCTSTGDYATLNRDSREARGNSNRMILCLEKEYPVLRLLASYNIALLRSRLQLQ